MNGLEIFKIIVNKIKLPNWKQLLVMGIIALVLLGVVSVADLTNLAKWFQV